MPGEGGPLDWIPKREKRESIAFFRGLMIGCTAGFFIWFVILFVAYLIVR